jgi:hypothetical protein
VRKASVFCLVALHNVVGEETLLPHLAELSGTKVRQSLVLVRVTGVFDNKKCYKRFFFNTYRCLLQMKLLNLYIKRSQASSFGARP